PFFRPVIARHPPATSHDMRWLISNSPLVPALAFPKLNGVVMSAKEKRRRPTHPAGSWLLHCPLLARATIPSKPIGTQQGTPFLWSHFPSTQRFSSPAASIPIAPLVGPRFSTTDF